MGSFQSTLADELRNHGLRVGGVLDLSSDERLRAGLCPPARSLVLVSAAGPVMWPHFSAWRAAQPSDPADPLDSWSRGVIGAIAKACGGFGVFPSDKPYLPFQAWAMRACGLKPSPLGLLIDPEYGLWHAFRGAIVFDQPLKPDMAEGDVNRPCDTCQEKPCLGTCPVNAVSAAAFDFQRCRNHLASGQGRACMETGCLARNACPVGTVHRYSAEQQAFHQRAFARS